MYPPIKIFTHVIKYILIGRDTTNYRLKFIQTISEILTWRYKPSEMVKSFTWAFSLNKGPSLICVKPKSKGKNPKFI